MNETPRQERDPVGRMGSSENLRVTPEMQQRPGDQPLPIKNDSPIVQNLVREDIYQRLQVGIERYGTGLQANNGRDMLQDAYEEALDLATYLRGMLLERDGR